MPLWDWNGILGRSSQACGVSVLEPGHGNWRLLSSESSPLAGAALGYSVPTEGSTN